MEEKENKKEVTTSEQFRELWKESGLTYVQLADLLGIRTDTVAKWIANLRNPPQYVVEYTKMILKKNNPKTNGDYIRSMNNGQLRDFLIEFYDYKRKNSLEMGEYLDSDSLIKKEKSVDYTKDKRRNLRKP
mgnify:FL=1|jgi:DNA-binding transcriptional regulator YiaG